MFEIITTIAELVIALAGIFITILEARKAKKEKELDDALILIEQNLITSVSNTSLGEDFKLIYDSMSQVIDNNDPEGWARLENKLPQITECYKAFVNGLRPIYKQLLKDESRFSLSYGFGRYIDAIRKIILSLDDVEKIETSIKDFLEAENACNNEAGKYFIREMRIMYQTSERYPKMSEFELENYFESEKKKKFPTYTKEKEEAVYAMYRLYYKMRCSINRLYNYYNEFYPFINELKIKYSK